MSAAQASQAVPYLDPMVAGEARKAPGRACLLHRGGGRAGEDQVRVDQVTPGLMGRGGNCTGNLGF